MRHKKLENLKEGDVIVLAKTDDTDVITADGFYDQKYVVIFAEYTLEMDIEAEGRTETWTSKTVFRVEAKPLVGKEYVPQRKTIVLNSEDGCAQGYKVSPGDFKVVGKMKKTYV